MRDIESNWQFVLLACDGIWDVLTNQARQNVNYGECFLIAVCILVGIQVLDKSGIQMVKIILNISPH